MQIKINGKDINQGTAAKPKYSNAQGWAVIVIGFSIVFLLLNYWGWFG